MIIGFDFDKVFIDYPPLIPTGLINFFYRNGIFFFKKNPKKKLFYRFPGKLEQEIRIYSHVPFLRQLINENVRVLKKIDKSKKNKIYLISSRYSFLKNRTENVLKINNLNNYFSEICLNSQNKQPHIFKDETLKKLKVNIFVDDDLETLLYIQRKNKKIKLFWLSSKRESIQKIDKIIKISKLSEIELFLK